MKKVYTIALILLALILQGCNPGSKNESAVPPSEPLVNTQHNDFQQDAKVKATTPTIGTLNYFSALEAGNIPEIKSCLSKEASAKVSDKSLKLLSIETQKTKKNFRIWMENIKGNTAKVQYLYNNTSDDAIIKDTIEMVLENDEWKVNLSIPNQNTAIGENEQQSTYKKK